MFPSHCPRLSKTCDLQPLSWWSMGVWRRWVTHSCSVTIATPKSRRTLGGCSRAAHWQTYTDGVMTLHSIGSEVYKELKRAFISTTAPDDAGWSVKVNWCFCQIHGCPCGIRTTWTCRLGRRVRLRGELDLSLHPLRDDAGCLLPPVASRGQPPTALCLSFVLVQTSSCVMKTFCVCHFRRLGPKAAELWLTCKEPVMFVCVCVGSAQTVYTHTHSHHDRILSYDPVRFIHSVLQLVFVKYIFLGEKQVTRCESSNISVFVMFVKCFVLMSFSWRSVKRLSSICWWVYKAVHSALS